MLILNQKKMIKNNALAERLNAFRKGETLPENPKQIEIEEETSLLDNLLFDPIFNNIFNLFYTFLKSISYGFALKTIFVTNWSFLGFLAIGFSIDLLISYILSLFYKDD